jgi:hypothetical protein
LVACAVWVPPLLSPKSGAELPYGFACFAASVVVRHAGSFDGDDSVCGDVVQPAGKSLIRSVDALAICLSDLAHAGDAHATTTAMLAVTTETAN